MCGIMHGWYVTYVWGIFCYGDLFPIEPLGKLIGSLSIVCGILVLALPITVVGSNFTEVWNEYRGEKLAEDERAKDEFRQRQREQMIAEHKSAMGPEAVLLAARTPCGYCKQAITKQRFKCIQCGMNMDVDCLANHHDPNHIVLLIPEGGVNLSLTSEFPDPLGKVLEKTLSITDEEKDGGLKTTEALKMQLPQFECENPDCIDGDCTESSRCLSCNIHFCSACSDFHRKDHVQLYLRSGSSESLIVLLAMSFAASEQRKRQQASDLPQSTAQHGRSTDFLPLEARLTTDSSAKPTLSATPNHGDEGSVKVEMTSP